MARHSLEMLMDILFFFSGNYHPCLFPPFKAAARALRFYELVQRVKQPNQRVSSKFEGFRRLAFEFHKAKFRRTWGSESLFPSQWAVNYMCVCTCTLGVHRCPKVAHRHMGTINQISFQILNFLLPLLKLICLWTLSSFAGFLVYFSHLPFCTIPPSLHSCSCYDGKIPKGQTEEPWEIPILRKQSDLLTGKHILFNSDGF